MALSSVLKKIEKAKKEYEKQLASIGSELADAISAELAPLIPEGWQLYWKQDDQMYNDEDYYFGITGPFLISEREPRQGELVKEEVKAVIEEYNDHYFGKSTRYKVYPEPSEYKWILDKSCPKRTETPELWDTPGVINIDDFDEEWACGISEEKVQAIEELFDEIGESSMRQAFGDSAEITIKTNGKVTVE